MDSSTQTQTTSTFPPGTIIDGRYKIRKAIGAGGMGAIYVAEHLTFGRDVAVKVLNTSAHDDQQAHERFMREAKAVCHLQHPNLVTYHDFGTDPETGALYLILELLKGNDLATVLRSGPRLSSKRIIHILTQLCDALAEAHAHGVIHRDLKPANVMLVNRGDDPDFVKLIDFGIVRVVQEEMYADGLTGAGMLVGTPSYLAPEYIQFQQVDHRVDLYALGVIGYELISGIRPFIHRKAGEVLRMHVQSPIPPLTHFRDGQPVPASLAEPIMRALAKQPEERQSDIRSFKQQLVEATQSETFERTQKQITHIAPDTTETSLDPKRRRETTSKIAHDTTIERNPTYPNRTTPVAAGLPPAKTETSAVISTPEKKDLSANYSKWVLVLIILTGAIFVLRYYPPADADLAAVLPERGDTSQRSKDSSSASMESASVKPQTANDLPVLPARALANESTRPRLSLNIAHRSSVNSPSRDERRSMDGTVSRGAASPPKKQQMKRRKKRQATHSVSKVRAKVGPAPKTKKRFRIEVMARPYGVIRYRGRVLGEDYVVTSLPPGRACFSIGENRKVSCKEISGPTRLSLPAK